MSYTPSEARGQELQWLLTLTIGGTVVRVSDLEAEVDDVATGAVYVYAAGLDGVSPPALALGDLGSAPSASASVSFLWPSADGLADLLALDGDPSDAYGELALWVPGTDYSRRHVVVQGAARISGSGEPHELVDVEISLRLSDDLGLVPDATVTADRWPRAGSSLALPEGSVDAPYPLVFGAPGHLGSPALDAHTGWRVYVVELDGATSDNSANDATVLLHGGDAAMVGASILLTNATTGLSTTVTPARSQDLLGSVVVVATVALGDLAIADGDELWASATSSTPVGVVAENARGGGLSRAGNVARWLLLRAVAVPVDLAGSDLVALNAYRLDARVDAQRTPTELLADLLSLLPCAWAVTPDGLALRAWPSEDALEVARVGPDYGCERAGPVEYSEPNEVRDVQRIDYDLDAASGDYARSLTLGPDVRTLDASNVVLPSARHARARGRGAPTSYGFRVAEVLQADAVCDPGTAMALGAARARRNSRVRATVIYDCPAEYQFHGLGVVVRWVDADLGRDEAVRVMAIEHGTTRCRLTLETLGRTP